MKRAALLRHLRRHACVLKREGGRHSLWMNPANGTVQAIPRHVEVSDRLVERICVGLGLPRPWADDPSA